MAEKKKRKPKPAKCKVRAAAARKGYDRKRCGVDVPMIGDRA